MAAPPHPRLQAAKLAKETSSTKQDATVEVAIRLGVDPRKCLRWFAARSTCHTALVRLPRRVFAVGEKADATAAPASDVVGRRSAIAEDSGRLPRCRDDTDQSIKVGRIARVLGPRGLMPN